MMAEDEIARRLHEADFGAAAGWDDLSDDRRVAYRRMAAVAVALRDEAVAAAILDLETAIEA